MSFNRRPLAPFITGRKRAYFGSSRELHSDTRQDLNASKPMTTNHLLQNTLTTKENKSMADNSELVQELKFLLWKLSWNKELMAENLALLKKINCKIEELRADNLEQVKRLNFFLGFNMLDEAIWRNLEIARNLDPAKINGLMTNLELDKKLDYVNEEMMAIIMELVTEVDFTFRKTEKGYTLVRDYMELVKELNNISKKIVASDAVTADNLALVRKLEPHAIWKINANNKLMAFNLELVKILDYIIQKSDAKDKLMARMEPYTSDNVNKGLMVENLRILTELDIDFEKIDVNEEWMADNLEVMGNLHFVVRKINANERLIKKKLKLVERCQTLNDYLTVGHFARGTELVVAVGKISVNEALLSDIRKSQLDLGKIIAHDSLVTGYLELVKMLVLFKTLMADNLELVRKSDSVHGIMDAKNHI